jgi:hypothetical protein
VIKCWNSIALACYYIPYDKLYFISHIPPADCGPAALPGQWEGGGQALQVHRTGGQSGVAASGWVSLVDGMFQDDVKG